MSELSKSEPTADIAPPSGDRDEQLAEILADLMERARQGHSVDIEAVANRHPELADELRELWGTAQLFEGFAQLPAEATQVTRSDQSQEAGRAPTGRTASPPRQFGEFEILEELGRGGMGVVYKARQRGLDRVVALKLLLRGEHASAVDIARFRAEAGSAANLDHPHITPVYEVGEHDGQPYFSMKYIEGTTLAKLLAEGPLPARRAAAILLPVCRAIAEAHRRGVLHRDLKPSNILIDTEGQPHVTDFGLAKRFRAGAGQALGGSLTHSGAILGTPSYMAPEQAAGRRGEIVPASDVYSLGTILYHMLTGRPPFQAASPVDTLLMVLEQDPLPPRLLNPKADPDLEMIALKCLQKPPELRYPTAAALADDLEAFLASEPISARSTNLTQIMSRMLRETHHASVLENWGLLWMWHSLVLLVLCTTTNVLFLNGMRNSFTYLVVWTMGFWTWAAIFWALRRRAGPITFVERQIAHVWAGSVIGSTLLYFIEMIMQLPVLSLSPVLGLMSGMVFLVKAGILSGAFYVQAIALFLTAFVMAWFPDYGVTIFGVVSALCFFVPGLKYYRQSRRTIEV
ncbi:MAG TPA: serine/threonine-protein kinase [Planctomycetaceae bacterium]|nr:serine/threonine-protein kinase [Planctomycetaceae bacterium]